jgi:hypothetical protein
MSRSCWLLVAALVVSACSDPSYQYDAGSPDAASHDASVEQDADASRAEDAASADAATPNDAAQPPDAASDAAQPVVDSGSPDAGADAAARDTGTPPSGSVILDLSAAPPPSSFPVGSWPSQQMRTGKWRFSWTPTFPSNALPVADNSYIVLLQFGGSVSAPEAVWLERQGDVCKAWITATSSQATLSIRPLVFSAGQTITYEIDAGRGVWTVSGASSGDGTYQWNTGFGWPDGTLWVGRSNEPGVGLFSGDFSNVESVP